MRIIGGIHGGRKFHPPTKMPARPTTDIAKEGLFNILQNMIGFSQIKTLDLFGGTGSISYELASRGCKDLTIIEQDQHLVQFIKQNSSLLKFENFKVIRSEVFKFINHTQESFDFIFAGPPYALKNIDDIPKLIFEKKLLKENGIFVLEHTPRTNYEDFSFFFRNKNYGTTVFSFFKMTT